jgi:hypothetical protein
MTNVLDATVSGSNGTDTTSAITVTGASDTTLYIDGDSNSDQLTVDIYVDKGNTGDWHLYSSRSVDATSGNNNNVAEAYDVNSVNGRARWEITNGNASDTDLVVDATKSQNR